MYIVVASMRRKRNEALGRRDARISPRCFGALVIGALLCVGWIVYQVAMNW